MRGREVKKKNKQKNCMQYYILLPLLILSFSIKNNKKSSFLIEMKETVFSCLLWSVNEYFNIMINEETPDNEEEEK